MNEDTFRSVFDAALARAERAATAALLAPAGAVPEPHPNVELLRPLRRPLVLQRRQLLHAQGPLR